MHNKLHRFLQSTQRKSSRANNCSCEHKLGIQEHQPAECSHKLIVHATLDGSDRSYVHGRMLNTSKISKMKTSKPFLLAILALLASGCHSTKQTVATTNSTVQTDATPLLFMQNDFVAPGVEELQAIQVQFKDVTLDNLKEGHFIYTEGACVSCHNAVAIRKFDINQWKNIIDDMAQRTTLSDKQKDAVYKYVLSIKAKQAGTH